MFEIKHMVKPKSLEEAYSTLVAHRHNRLLGGCAFLKMGQLLIKQGIDLSSLELNTIDRADGWINIGATCTYADLTSHPWLQSYAGGLIPRALSPIVGVQFRHSVQVGASVFSKYGFSDFIPALLAIGAEVTLYHDGRMPVAEFLERPLSRDILVAVHLPDHPYIASSGSLRLTASDLPIVNCAVARDFETGIWRIAVGALPSRARLVPAGAEVLMNKDLTDETIAEVVALAQMTLPFGSNARASENYRRAMAGVLLERALQEVRSC